MLDILVQPRRNAKAARRFLKRVIDRFGAPRGIIRTPQGNEGETNAYLSATVAMVLMDAGAGEMRIRQLPYASDTICRFSLG